MSEQPLLITDAEVWDNLLYSEASQLYLAAQVKKAEELLEKDFPQQNNSDLNLCEHVREKA